MSSYSTAYLDISYHKRRRTLFGRWRRAVMPFELQRGYAALLAEATQQQCCFWVVDLQRRVAVDGADVSWTLDEFFPKLRAQLGGTVYVAAVITPEQLVGSLAALVAYTHDHDAAVAGYDLQCFTQEDDALKWLRRCRRRAQALAR